MKHTPSRARFSKPPPKKNTNGGGRGGSGGDGRGGDGARGSDDGRGGDGARGGRGGRGSGGRSQTKAAASVVRKITQRVQEQGTGSSSSSSGPAAGNKDPLKGIDTSRLDELTLSEASVNLITQLLTDLMVIHDAVPASAGTGTTTPNTVSTEKDDYADYQQDGPDEQDDDYAGGSDDDDVDQGGGWYEDGQETTWEGSDKNNNDNSNTGGIELLVDDAMQRDPVFCHLTVQLSFSQQNAARAVHQGQSMLLPAAQAPMTTDPTTSNNKNAGTRVKLTNALDWLCLHLSEKDLEAGFKRNKDSMDGKMTMSADSRLRSSSKNGTILVGTGATRAIPHPSITVAKKLTDDMEWRKLTRLEERAVGFLRLGFHSAEAMQACDDTDDPNLTTGSKIEAIQDSDTLVLMLSALEKETRGEAAQSGTLVDNTAAAEEREMEREALTAIYEDQFEILYSGHGLGRWKAKINPVEESGKPVSAQHCELHIFIRPGYPGAQVPLFLLTNPSLPPPLLRQINAAIVHEAHSIAGAPVIFDIISFVESNLSSMKSGFLKEQRAKEFEAGQLRLRKAAGHDVDEELDESSDKKVGRRQKARIKGAEKAYDNNDKVQREEQQKRQQKRIENVKSQDKTIRQSMAELAIERRDKERMNEEMEKVTRAAMNNAFNRGESADGARAAAQLAKQEFLLEHGIAEAAGVEHKAAPVKNEQVSSVDEDSGDVEDVSDEVENSDASTKLPVATPTTMAFMDRLRGMYDVAAQGKTAGAYPLAKPNKPAGNEANDKDIVGPESVPCPVAVPVGDLAKVMEEVIAIQTEQPWLVSEEARAPGAVSDRDGLTSDQLRRREDLSNSLRKALEQKRGSSKGPYQKMLAQRQRLPAYKMGEDIVSTIARNQITVIAGDTGCG
jgi:hypothetical protein